MWIYIYREKKKVFEKGTSFQEPAGLPFSQDLRWELFQKLPFLVDTALASAYISKFFSDILHRCAAPRNICQIRELGTGSQKGRRGLMNAPACGVLS